PEGTIEGSLPRAAGAGEERCEIGRLHVNKVRVLRVRLVGISRILFGLIIVIGVRHVDVKAFVVSSLLRVQIIDTGRRRVGLQVGAAFVGSTGVGAGADERRDLR